MKLYKRILKQPFEYLLAIILVYGNGTWLQLNYNVQFKAILISTLLFYLLVKIIKKQINLINPIALFIPILLLLCTLLNFSNKSNLNTIISTSSIIVILSFLNKKTLTIILDKYAEIIFGLMIISLIISLIVIIYPEFIYHFPHRNDGFVPRSKGYYNLFFSTERVIRPLAPLRMQSIFWEPGAWAVNQGFAFFWYMFYKKNYKVIYIFIICTVLTASTSGFLITLILSIYLYRNKIDEGLTKSIRKVILGLAIFSLIIITYSATESFVLIPQGGPNTSYQHDLIDRATRTVLLSTVEKISSQGVQHGSAQSRFETLVKTYERSLDRPLLGVGMLRGEYLPFVTHVFGELIYQNGYLFTLFWLILFSQLFKKIPIRYSIPIIFVLLYAEAYAFGTLFILIIVFGSKILLEKRFAKKWNIDSYVIQ